MNRDNIGIVTLGIVAVIAYFIVLDQITAQICIEHFTFSDERDFDSDEPTLLGIGWASILGTWWIGLLFGIALVFAARAGVRPKREWRSLVRPVATLLLAMAGCGLVGGAIGWQLALADPGPVINVGPTGRVIWADRHVPFMICEFAHSASNLVGFVGGIVVPRNVWRSRGQWTTYRRRRACGSL